MVPGQGYSPDGQVSRGQPICRTMDQVGPVDMVVVFRKPNDIPRHVDEIIAAHPKYVWFQLGIRNEEAARRFAEAGIGVIQDKCTMVEHKRGLARRRHAG